MIDYAWLLIALPAAGALINLFLGRWFPRKAIGWIATAVVGLAFVLGMVLFNEMQQLPAENRQVTVHLWDWITVGDFKVNAAILLSPLSIVMVLVVTSVGTLIHIYSMGYMAHDERYQRYFVFLNFFIFSMLVLVLADSFLSMFIGWEGVGLASFLLIGFWFDKRDDTYGWYADAGKKAFLVNRVGDFGIILAMILIWVNLGTLSFLEVGEGATALSVGTATAIALLLLLGVAGKSAQIPLYIWLPDAMAGPTPVSALIHAATMVTAGVYLMVRTADLWLVAAPAMFIASWIGALTAFFAATLALTQTDLKKILAYSTISQLGFMVLAAGVGAYGAAIFHLTTHAFFKSLLFLGAGSVMHATGGELDIRKMGGLRHKMPATFITFTVGAAALAGLPLLSGYFSKDAILLGAMGERPVTYLIGLAAALMTAFYAFRAVFLTFNGEPRDKELYLHAHESPKMMTIPLWILAFLAIFGGALNLPFALTMEKWLEPVIGHHVEPSIALEIFGLVIGGLIAILGVWMAYSRYLTDQTWVENFAARFRRLQPALDNYWYVDSFYSKYIVGPILKLAGWFTSFDRRGIDGAVNGVGSVSLRFGERLRHLQNGLIPTYVLSIFIGVVVMVLYFVFMA